jgi:hypothetical protein
MATFFYVVVIPIDDRHFGYTQKFLKKDTAVEIG